ncbi:succinylglutamate desuccinylase/aspartoacylase family protein [Nocardioides antri]|nr:succinylglutamate desuccinylase/aspartoacylase family protein [Nocardioides antri]
MVHARLRDGSLRQAAVEVGAKVLLYEAGEALRFDAVSIATGVAGIRRVLEHLGMVDPQPTGGPLPSAVESRSTGWVRARGTGILNLETELGAFVEAGQRLGGLSDTFGRRVRLVRADRSGIVIGLTRAPVVNAGDALVHIAAVEQ